MNRVTFKDLSIPVKISVIVGWIYGGWLIAAFLVGAVGVLIAL